MNKNESKYFYTASLMDEALLSLLVKKDFEYITIKELCEKAGVNRSTFYLHYESINDLLDETIKYINDKFKNSFNVDDNNDLLTNILTTKKFLKPYLNFVKGNIKIYKLIHTKSQLFHIKKTFEELYNNIFSHALTHFGVDEKSKKYVLLFYIEGTLGIIKHWIDNNCVDDIDLIIELIEKCTTAKNN